VNRPIERLQAEFRKRQAKNPQLSLRSFARWLEVSPAQLSQILSRRRALTPKTAQKIAGKLSFSPREKMRFLAGVSPQADAASREWEGDQRRARLEEDRFRLIADWYHFAILSLTKTPGAKADPRWISRRLGISVATARGAVERLERLGIVETKPRFRQVSPPMEVLPTVPSEAVRKFHAQNLAVAAEKLERVPMARRNFQGITFAANPARLPEVESLIDRFLGEVADLFEETSPTEVFTLAVQLFPVTIETRSSP
jgi:uncharacterized protein (TIGR02147 family)